MFYRKKKLETFFTENNITPIYAPAKNHRAIGLVQRLNQPFKRQLSCVKAHLNKKFNLAHSIHAIIQRLRISKRKTIENTPFEAHFGRRCNTPTSNITTKSSNKNLNFNKIIKCYFDEDTIPGRSYLTDTQWADTGMCSDFEIERVICAANSQAHEEQEKKKYGDSRLMFSAGILRPIQRRKRSVQMKIALKIHQHRDIKRTWMGYAKSLHQEFGFCKIRNPK